MTKKDLQKIKKLGKEILEKGEVIVYSDDVKSSKELTSFTKYCVDHPEERFWQALRNWAKVGYILKANMPIIRENGINWKDVKDTFWD